MYWLDFSIEFVGVLEMIDDDCVSVYIGYWMVL